MFVLGLFSSTALYAIIYALVCTIWLGVDMMEMLSVALFAYIVIRILRFIWSKLTWRKWRKIDSRMIDDEPFFLKLISITWYDITNPFRGLVALKGASKIIDTKGILFLFSWMTVILHFVWSIVLLGSLTFGFIVMV